MANKQLDDAWEQFDDDRFTWWTTGAEAAEARLLQSLEVVCKLLPPEIADRLRYITDAELNSNSEDVDLSPEDEVLSARLAAELRGLGLDIDRHV